MLCISDQLGAIADAVGDVVWPAVGSVPTGIPDTYLYGEGDAAASNTDFFSQWDISPQSDADRFIARDLAIHNLAMIPVLDSYTDIIPGQSCSSAFAAVNTTPPGVDIFTPGASLTATERGNISKIFGVSLDSTPWKDATPAVPIFPPSNAPYIDALQNDNMPAIAGTALDIEAQILRASGRLLHDLVRRDVYSDLAAAAQNSAQSLDPVGGNLAAWGQDDAGTGASLYGTISHAARVLMGRWEIGNRAAVQTDGGSPIIPTSVADPECEDVQELDLLPGAFGTDYSARSLDEEVRTPGEQTAVQLVERSGIVIPSCALATASDSSLQQALLGQLLLEEQVQNNLPVPPPAAALTDVLSTLSPGDATFAFQRALLTWSLLTNMAPG
ncbi:MAG: hypothetical protein OK454_09745, partial [Thaumarchaeota archaeon]|nr:hypothetical protein [Nitrososphaerota archaeon]